MREWIKTRKLLCKQWVENGDNRAEVELQFIAEIEQLEAVRGKAEKLLTIVAWFREITKDNPAVEKAIKEFEQAIAVCGEKK